MCAVIIKGEKVIEIQESLPASSHYIVNALGCVIGEKVIVSIPASMGLDNQALVRDLDNTQVQAIDTNSSDGDSNPVFRPERFDSMTLVVMGEK